MNKHWAQQQRKMRTLWNSRFVLRYIQHFCVCVYCVFHRLFSLFTIRILCASCHMLTFYCVIFWRLGRLHTHKNTNPTQLIHMRPGNIYGWRLWKKARDSTNNNTHTHIDIMKIKFYRPRCVYSACFAYFIGKQQPPYVSFDRSHSLTHMYYIGIIVPIELGRYVNRFRVYYFGRRPIIILCQIL